MKSRWLYAKLWLRRNIRLIGPIIPAILLLLSLVLAANNLPSNVTTANDLEPWKAWNNAFVVVATAIMTLTGAYVGATLQGQREMDKETRQIRRERTKVYRDYLTQVMIFGQRVDMLTEFVKVKQMDEAEAVNVVVPERNKLLRTKPPVGHLSGIDDQACRDCVDHAIDLATRYWREMGLARPSASEVQHSYLAALNESERYENKVY